MQQVINNLITDRVCPTAFDNYERMWGYGFEIKAESDLDLIFSGINPNILSSLKFAFGSLLYKNKDEDEIGQFRIRHDDTNDHIRTAIDIGFFIGERELFVHILERELEAILINLKKNNIRLYDVYADTVVY
jgi:hypothetical protein